jgi:HPt (histidine-containing phosphotransfer) domain-containing protein
MTQAAQDILQGQLETIRAKFISLLDDRLDELECLREQIDHEDKRQNALYHIQFIAHKIYGSAATLGLTDVGQSAAKTEETIIQYLIGIDPIPTLEETKNIIDSFLDKTADVSSSAYWQNARP